MKSTEIKKENSKSMILEFNMVLGTRRLQVRLKANKAFVATTAVLIARLALMALREALNLAEPW